MERSERFRAISGMECIQEEIGEWAARTFQKDSPAERMSGSVNHLKKELKELEEGLTDLLHTTTGREYHECFQSVQEEAADMFILLVNIAHFAGFSLAEAVMAKHDINLKRTWKAPNKDGVIEHVREGEAA